MAGKKFKSKHFLKSSFFALFKGFKSIDPAQYAKPTISSPQFSKALVKLSVLVTSATSYEQLSSSDTFFREEKFLPTKCGSNFSLFISVAIDHQMDPEPPIITIFFLDIN